MADFDQLEHILNLEELYMYEYLSPLKSSSARLKYSQIEFWQRLYNNNIIS